MGGVSGGIDGLEVRLNDESLVVDLICARGAVNSITIPQNSKVTAAVAATTTKRESRSPTPAAKPRSRRPPSTPAAATPKAPANCAS